MEPLPAHASNRTRFLAATANGMTLVFAGDPRGGIESIRAAVRLAEHDKGLRARRQFLSLLVMGPLWIRETGSGRDVEEAIETARAQAALGILPGLLTRVARDHAGSDDWATGAVEYDESSGSLERAVSEQNLPRRWQDSRGRGAARTRHRVPRTRR